MITIAIIVLTVVTSLMAFGNREVYSRTLFNPFVISTRNEYYRFLTSGFIHADYMHLFFNMYALYLFGSITERDFAHTFEGYNNTMYIVLYISGLIMSQMFSFYKHKEDPRYNALGASGAVSSVIFCSIMLHPTQTLFILPLPIPIPAFIFGPLYLFYSWYMGKRGMDNIGHDAHFFGAIWGILFIAISYHEVIPLFFQQIQQIFQ